jgi:hypothetical protein
MGVLGRLAHGGFMDRNVPSAASAAGRLLRACIAQVEALRLRNGGFQTVREHVHVNDGGQAIVGIIDK